MTDADHPRPDDRDRDGRPVEPARDPADAPAVDFGGPAEPARDPADAPAVDFGGPAEPARDPADAPAVDPGSPAASEADRAEPVDPAGDQAGRHDDDVEARGELFPPAASLRDDEATPTTADGSVAAAEVPGGEGGRRGDSGLGGDSVEGDASVDPDRLRDVDGDADRPSDRDRASARDGETEVIAPLDERRDDASGTSRADADEAGATDRDGDHDAARPVVPPVVAPADSGARAWSVAPAGDDDGPRRPLHDDEALRAAEAARDEPVRRDDDRDGRDDSTVAAPVVAGAAGVAAGSAAGARSDDGRFGEARTTALPAHGSTSTGAIERDRTGGYPTTDDGDIDRVGLRRDLLAEQKEEFGGMRIGAGLLGWFAATGLGVVLFTILASIVTAIVVGSSSDASAATLRSTLEDQGTVLSLVMGIGVLVIVFVGYLVGGYTASRVARFSGFKQGLATWLWGLVITIVVTVVVGIVAVQTGDQSAPNSMVPTVDDLTSMSVESLVFLGLLLVLSFVGAVLGGVLGQRWHRRVDRFIPEHQV